MKMKGMMMPNQAISYMGCPKWAYVYKVRGLVTWYREDGLRASGHEKIEAERLVVAESGNNAIEYARRSMADNRDGLTAVVDIIGVEELQIGSVDAVITSLSPLPFDADPESGND